MGLFCFCVSCVYSAAGLAAFVVFMMMRFYAAAVFGITTAAISGVTAQLNWLHSKRRLNLWYEYRDLDQFFWLGFWTFALGTSGFVYHTAAIIAINEYQMSLVVAAIWGIITMKCGGVLMHFAHKYWKEITSISLISAADA